jgi:outer membrane murein-binding lipoprotein Lpp
MKPPDAGKLVVVRTFRTGSARLVAVRPRWRPIFGAVVLSLVVLAGCGSSKFQYVSSSNSKTYLKVPKDWKKFDQQELVGAELSAAREANQPSSLIDVLVNRQFQWRVAFDSAPRPSVDHTLTLADEPVVEVSVRQLEAAEREQVSLAALRNVVINYDEQKQMAQDAISSGTVGVNGATTAAFRPIDEQELNLPDGVHGVRLRYVLRPDSSSSFYAFDQTSLVDARSQRLYVLLIRSSESQFLLHNNLFDEIAKSFTVKAKG